MLRYEITELMFWCLLQTFLLNIHVMCLFRHVISGEEVQLKKKHRVWELNFSTDLWRLKSWLNEDKVKKNILTEEIKAAPQNWTQTLVSLI